MGIGAASQATASDDPFAALDALGPAVADDELSDVRGKFIRPDSVSYFGISMVTSWQDATGITTVARLSFNVDFLTQENGVPLARLSIGWVREGDPAMDVTDNHAGYTPYLIAQQVLPEGSLGSTQGAAQANIISGADNSALNGMQIALIPRSEIGQLQTGQDRSISESATHGFADGDQLQFLIGENELGLAMTGNGGTDSTLQTIGGDFGRALQQTVLNSDGNAVLNNTAIVIGTDMASAPFTAIRATEALSAMHGHGF